MKELLKKYKIILSIGIVIFCIGLFLICYFNIPRISYTYNEKTDSYYVDRVYGNAKHYTVLDSVKGKPVTAIGAKAFMDKKRLKTIDFGSSILEIERLAFSGCRSLQEISLESVEVVGRNAFADCISLQQINCNAKSIEGGAFYGCHALEEVSLNQTEWIGSFAFADTAISELVLPSSLTRLGEDAFYQCRFLKKIQVPSKAWLQNNYLLSLENVKIVE